MIFWVTFFPLISEAITGTQVSVGPPAFRPFVVPIALLVVALSGIGPIIAWRRVTVAKLRRGFAFPVAFAAGVLVALLIFTDATRHPFAFLMFVFGSFVIAAVVQEFFRGGRARRAMTGEAPPVALFGLVRRNRRRYGGYIVHAGVRGRADRRRRLDLVPAPALRIPAPGPERADRRVRRQVPEADRDRPRRRSCRSAPSSASTRAGIA